MTRSPAGAPSGHRPSETRPVSGAVVPLPDGRAAPWTQAPTTMSQPVPPPPDLDRAKRQLEGDLLSLLQDFERRSGRCVGAVRVVNASTYEGGRCPGAVHVQFEE